MDFIKAWLQKKPIGAERIPAWVISTSQSRPVQLFESKVSLTASFSSWDGTPKTRSLTHTVFLNCTDEVAEQYQKMAKGNVFYFAMPEDDSQAITVLTPKQYQNEVNADVSDELKEGATAQ